MKKILLTVAIATASIFCSAQVELGAKAGLNFANITSDDIDLNGITSFHAGIYADYIVSDVFSIQPELLFSFQGAETDDIPFVGKQKWNPLYVNLPVMAKFYPIENLSVEVGPQLGFLISDGDMPSYIDTNVVDFGLAFGAGYKLDNGLNFYGRYVLGLTDVSTDFDSKNGVGQIGLGYTFKKF